MVNTNLNWSVSLYSFMEIISGNMGTGFEIPKLDLAIFSPLIKGSDHCSLHFLRIFFSGEGAGEGQYPKRQNSSYKCF